MTVREKVNPSTHTLPPRAQRAPEGGGFTDGLYASWYSLDADIERHTRATTCVNAS